MKGSDCRLKTDMITLFNQLTSQELADYTLFSDIVDLHYEKFKYLYYMLKKVDLSKISKILCTEDADSMSVSIEPKSIDYTNDLMYCINERKSSYKKSEYFTIDVTCYEKTIHIVIGMVGDEKEGDLYADRLI